MGPRGRELYAPPDILWEVEGDAVGLANVCRGQDGAHQFWRDWVARSTLREGTMVRLRVFYDRADAESGLD